jgi:alpha-1,3-glucan synthase
MVFPKQANYSQFLLHDEDGKLTVSHSAPGADKWRYSLNWASSWSDWQQYTGGNDTLAPQPWSGTKAQEWEGDHVIIQYWSKISGSSDHIQHGDANWKDQPPRRLPHLWVEGPFNQQGFDSGLKNQMALNKKTGQWGYNFMTEWPTQLSLSAWGMNPDGQPDETQIFGDIDGDNILDRLPAKTLLSDTFNVTKGPPSPYLAYRISVNDATLRYDLVPVGSRWAQMVLYFLLALIPVTTGAAAIFGYLKSFYAVKFNQVGVSDKHALIPLGIRRQFRRIHDTVSSNNLALPKKGDGLGLRNVSASTSVVNLPAVAGQRGQGMLDADAGGSRRTVLIATMEYDIEDWEIKIKIGGLGVMAQLMGKNLGHQDLIWVVPCVGGIDYPVDTVAEPMEVTVLGNSYTIDVQYHVLRNITYVLLDAPIFRQQSKSEPYPPRMDDLDSAIYYSAWNSCIAEAIKRFPIDLYHINDYHGAVAPLHLLPRTIPCCLSLHNAEFQGLWPMRTKTESEEVCRIYNLEPEIVEKYVQFGEVFNLLHAGASYLRVHQKGFGAVGVSKKYGKRSYARYPIFWGLKEIQALPNPDPSDTAEWTRGEKPAEAVVDPVFEAGRVPLKRQAQEWAGLDQNPQAELFVFVGRWSMQKGVDLIADVFPAVLEENPNVQLVCVGPVIDLYGSFAALKLGKMMTKYPGRVFSKPEFTALPPYIFSGAEFALIPSRDEPFGLVAVEFGRKGALGVGARVGGLGQMPGWWYTVESTTTKNLLHQFKSAISEALASKTEVRAIMRARSALQRFPVQQWVEDLETLQTTSIEKHWRYAAAKDSREKRNSLISLSNRPSGQSTPLFGRSRANSRAPSIAPSTATSRAPSPDRSQPVPSIRRLGSVMGPGHRPRGRDQQSSLTVVQQADEQGSSGEDDDMSEAGDDESFISRRSPSRGRAENASRAMYIGPEVGPDVNDPTLAQLTAQLQARDFSSEQPPYPAAPPYQVYEPSPPLSGQHTPALGAEEGLLNPPLSDRSKRNSSLSLAGVVGEKHDYNLQKVEPFFTDPNKEYYKAFEQKLDDLNGKNSETALCIEDFLEKSEKQWFNRYRDAKRGKSPAATPASSIFRAKRYSSPEPSLYEQDGAYSNSNDSQELMNQFLIDKDYVPPKGLKGFLLKRVGDWPLYSFLLAFGQIIAANSYQVTLLTGEIGEAAEKLYVVATIYLLGSIMWWLVFRSFKSMYVLSVPFLVSALSCSPPKRGLPLTCH